MIFLSPLVSVLFSVLHKNGVKFTAAADFTFTDMFFTVGKRMDLIMCLHIEWLEMSYCLSKHQKCSRWLKIKLFSLTCCIFDWLAGQLFDRRADNISSLLQVGLKFCKNDSCWQNGFTNQTCTIRATKIHYAFQFQ